MLIKQIREVIYSLVDIKALKAEEAKKILYDTRELLKDLKKGCNVA